MEEWEGLPHDHAIAVDTSDENAVHGLRVVPTDVKVGHAVGVVMERTCGHPSEEGHEFAVLLCELL